MMALGALGFELAVSIGVGTWLGYHFDVWAGSSPIGILVGVLGGLCGAFWRLMLFLRLLARVDRANRKDDNSQEGSEP